MFFNDKPIQQVSSTELLGLVLDPSITFDKYIKVLTSKVSKTIGMLRELNNRLPRSSLITI